MATMIGVIGKSTLYAGIGDVITANVKEASATGTVKKGEVVLREGETGTSMYIVVSGTLYATRRCEDGTEVRMLLFRPGDFVGVTTLIEMEPRPFTITAEKDAKLLELDSKDLYQLYRQDQKAYILVLQNINRELVRRLRKAGARIAHLTRLAGADHTADHH